MPVAEPRQVELAGVVLYSWPPESPPRLMAEWSGRRSSVVYALACPYCGEGRGFPCRSVRGNAPGTRCSMAHQDRVNAAQVVLDAVSVALTEWSTKYGRPL